MAVDHEVNSATTQKLVAEVSRVSSSSNSNNATAVAKNRAASPPRAQPATSSSVAVLAQVAISGSAIAAEVWLLSDVRESCREDFSNGLNCYKRTSLVWPLIIALAYLVIVVGFGRTYFRTREPWAVDGYMLTYNAFQTVFNLWAVYGFVSEILRRGLPFAGTRYVPGVEEERLGFLIYAHYQNKFIELLDTVWMVVRKKDAQVTSLHVIHHTIMPFAWICVLWVNPGGDAYFGAMMNSLIHVVMYSYYLLSALKLPCPWKKFITQLQLAQFCVIFVQGCTAVWLGSTPTWLTCVQQSVMILMLVMFSSFYRDAYNKKKNSGKSD